MTVDAILPEPEIGAVAGEKRSIGAKPSRRLLAPGIEEYIRVVVAAAPPLTAEQGAALRVMAYPDERSQRSKQR
ncbi:hypothetical protein [Dactylosporangium sp. CA-139066]|uniref:hypothetical protein n=1 Tax=Dactylosporangium sp. CA-139066 TaxID=3239930 RepID=UPI003D903239